MLSRVVRQILQATVYDVAIETPLEAAPRISQKINNNIRFKREELQPRIPGNYRFGDTRHACSDVSKIGEMGWTPQKNIKDSIQEYKIYLEEQLEIANILDYSEKQMEKMNIVRKAN